MAAPTPVVVIVGAGFGGLSAAKVLKKVSVQVVLVDQFNHHTFQPLLYQVATSVLAQGQIGSPIRELVRKDKNTTVVLGNVCAIDTQSRSISIDTADRKDAKLRYDYLILASGVQSSYFGHDEFRKYAPGLKSLADGAAIRNKILAAFEQAEAEEDPTTHTELLTFVLVGAGPTGVEMAGAIATMVRNTLTGEFRRIDPKQAKIVLVDRGDRPLASFSPRLSEAAKKRLESLGVEFRLGQSVESVDDSGVTVDGKRIPCKTVIWTAGVNASSLARQLKAETDKAGRVRINNDLTIPNHPEVMVIGDLAAMSQNGKPLPGVAQVAIQQGKYAGKLIRSRVSGGKVPAPFRYFDKGSLAVVGRNFAVLEIGKFQISGFLAWVIWAAIHLLYLGQASQRVSVLMQWMWTYVTGQRGSRLIVNPRCD